MLMPKKVKYRKQQRGRLKGVATRGNTVVFGDYGLKALEAAWITAQQIEAARRAIMRNVKKTAKVWIRVFPDKPVTAKPAETRMGGGKGDPKFWVAVVKPGRILFEVGGVTEQEAEDALSEAATKLPIATKIVRRAELMFEEGGEGK